MNSVFNKKEQRKWTWISPNEQVKNESRQMQYSQGSAQN